MVVQHVRMYKEGLETAGIAVLGCGLLQGQEGCGRRVRSLHAPRGPQPLVSCDQIIHGL